MLTGRIKSSNNLSSSLKKNLNISFGSIKSSLGTYQTRKAAENYIKANLSGTARFFNWFSKISGEIPTQIVNATGTGLVAPIFIAYNPLTKTDEKTKKYTALRQPISAILAVLTQTAIVIPFNHLLESMANTGDLGPKYDLSIRNTDRYIVKNIINKDKPLSQRIAEFFTLINPFGNKDRKEALRAAIDTKTLEIAGDQFENTVRQVKGVNRVIQGNEESAENIIKGVRDSEFVELIKLTANKIKQELEDEINKLHTDYYPLRFKRAKAISANVSDLESLIEKVTGLLNENEGNPGTPKKGF